MAIIANVTGLGPSVDGDSNRSKVYLEVQYNDLTYNWHLYMPAGKELGSFVNDNLSIIQADIDAKEAIWANTAKTRIITSEDGTTSIEPVDKSEIVSPDGHDYYIKRQRSYPSIPDQLDAIFKGEKSAEYKAMADVITTIKAIYPKKGQG